MRTARLAIAPLSPIKVVINRDSPDLHRVLEQLREILGTRGSR